MAAGATSARIIGAKPPASSARVRDGEREREKRGGVVRTRRDGWTEGTSDGKTGGTKDKLKILHHRVREHRDG